MKQVTSFAIPLLMAAACMGQQPQTATANKSGQSPWMITQRIMCGAGTTASPHTYTMATLVKPGVIVTSPLSSLGLVVVREPYTDYSCSVPADAMAEWRMATEPTIVWPKVGETIVVPVKDPAQNVTLMLHAKIAGINGEEFSLDQLPKHITCGDAAFSNEYGTPHLVGFYDCTKKLVVSAQRFTRE